MNKKTSRQIQYDQFVNDYLQSGLSQEEAQNKALQTLGPVYSQMDEQKKRIQDQNSAYKADEEARTRAEMLEQHLARLQEEKRGSRLSSYAGSLGVDAPVKKIEVQPTIETVPTSPPEPFKKETSRSLASPTHPETAVEQAAPKESQQESSNQPITQQTTKEFASQFSDPELRSAQESSSQRRFAANLGEAFTTIGAGFAGQKADPAFFNELRKQAGQPVTDLLQERKQFGENLKLKQSQAAADPNSPDNQAFRQFIKEKLPSLAQSPGFDSLTLANPTLTKLADMWLKSEDNKLRSQAINAQRELTSETRRQEMSARDERFRDSFGTKFVDSLNQDPVIKKKASVLSAADDIENLLNAANPVADNAIPTYMARLAGEVGALSEADKKPFGGSQSLLSQLNQTISNATAGKLTDENRQFVRSLVATIRKSSENTINRRKIEIVDQKSRAQSRFSRDELLDMAGIQQRDPQIEEYAKKYNIDYEKADQILRARGYGQK